MDAKAIKEWAIVDLRTPEKGRVEQLNPNVTHIKFSTDYGEAETQSRAGKETVLLAD